MMLVLLCVFVCIFALNVQCAILRQRVDDLEALLEDEDEADKSGPGSVVQP